MKKLLPFFACLFFFVQFAQAQNLVSSEYIGSRTQAELAALDEPVLNGVDFYRLQYETKDVDGNTTVASGLLAVPDDLTKSYPRAIYQHGTSANDDAVPSNAPPVAGLFPSEADIILNFGGKGYVVFAPDYLGLGVNEGLHPYVHAESEAWVAVDMLRAADEFLVQNNVEINDQVFITGYSQGGHAAMALHQMMELELSGEFTVTASAPMSGPYDISGVMRDLLFSEEEYGNPGYLIYTLVSYQEVYGDLYASVEDVIKEPYQDLVTEFAADNVSLEDMNGQLITLLEQNEGAVIVGKTFKEDYVDAILTDPDHPANVAMEENDVYDWVPTAPTRLYYCMADDQVPFENSIVAETSMNDAGAADVEAIDVNSLFNHVFCAFVAPGDAADFFAQYQLIEDLPPSSAFEEAASQLDIFPNPATERVNLSNLPTDGMARVFDLNGRHLLSQNVQPGDNTFEIGHLPKGIYMIEVLAGNQFWKEKLVVR